MYGTKEVGGIGGPVSLAPRPEMPISALALEVMQGTDLVASRLAGMISNLDGSGNKQPSCGESPTPPIASALHQTKNNIEQTLKLIEILYTKLF